MMTDKGLVNFDDTYEVEPDVRDDIRAELRAAPHGRPEVFDLIDHCQRQVDAEEEREWHARQDAYDDLRARCRLFDLIYHVTGGQPVPSVPVTHRRTPCGR